jgi:hypothetical protein
MGFDFSLFCNRKTIGLGTQNGGGAPSVLKEP